MFSIRECVTLLRNKLRYSGNHRNRSKDHGHWVTQVRIQTQSDDVTWNQMFHRGKMG